MGRGHLSLGTMILTVEAGKGGDGSFVSRNTDSNCRTRERWGGVICLLGTMILTVNQGEVGRGHLSLGTMILTVEPGRGGAICLFLSVEPGKRGRNNDSKCRTCHLSLGNYSSVESERWSHCL